MFRNLKKFIHVIFVVIIENYNMRFTYFVFWNFVILFYFSFTIIISILLQNFF